MADEKDVIVETPDVDDMSDTQVADLKKTMREEPAEKITETETKPVEKAKPEAADDDDEAGEKQATVPHGQFHRERERRKEAERLSSVATQRLAELLELQRPRQEPQVDPDPEPGDDDPVAQLQWNKRRIKALESYVLGGEAQKRQVTEQEQATNKVLNAVATRYAEKVAERPELQQITDYLINSFAREFAISGLQGLAPNGQVLPNSPVQAAVVEHVKSIARYCYQTDTPIEDYYENLAKVRGYQPANGEARARNEDGTFAKAEAERIDKLERTKQKAKSLGGTGAPVEMSEITPQTLLDMSDEEFAAYKKKNGGSLRGVFGTAH